MRRFKGAMSVDKKNETRICEPFNMTPQEYQSYKASKFTRLIWYAIGMLFISICREKISGYIMLTIILILSYVHDYLNECQWKKDGSMSDDT